MDGKDHAMNGSAADLGNNSTSYRMVLPRSEKVAIQVMAFTLPIANAAGAQSVAGRKILVERSPEVRFSFDKVRTGRQFVTSIPPEVDEVDGVVEDASPGMRVR